MRSPATRLLTLAALVFLAAPSARADRAMEIAQIHLEAIGGRERIDALRAIRAQGYYVAAGERVRFTMMAARPGRLRMELHYPDRTLVQAIDGANPPWEMDATRVPARTTAMSPAAADAFRADAEFDDPLVAALARGYRIEYAGEADVEGRKLLRLLITRNLTEAFHLLLDPTTYFIALRVDQRLTMPGQRVPIITRYADYRPVAGVLVAHEIAVMVGGKVTQQARLERVEANPRLPASLFARPD